MAIYFLLLITLIEFFFAYILFKRDYLNPAVIFSGVFLISSFDLFLMRDFWDIDLGVETVIIVATGIFFFIIVTYLIEYSTRRSGRLVIIEAKKIIKVNNILYPVLYVIYAVSIVLIFRYVISTARRYGGGGSIMSLIGTFNGLIKGATTDDVSYPFLLQMLADACGLSSYVWAYYIINNYQINKKINKIYLSFYILGLVVSLEGGSRGDAISILFVTACLVLFLFKKNTGRKKLPKKIYYRILIILLAVVLSFQIVGTNLGRDSNIFGPFEYISIYLGAPILNLDTMVKRYGAYNTIFFNYTFTGLYSSISRLTGLKLTISDPMVHLAHNGHRTGNVATTFLPFYYDGGLFGVILMCILMAFIMESMYISCRKAKERNGWRIIIYYYFLFLLARSFFANSVLNTIQLSLIKFLFYIIVEYRYLPKILKSKGVSI